MPKYDAEDLLMACAKGDHAEARRILEKAGPRRAPSIVATRDAHGFGPLHFAAAYGNLQLVRFLCDDHGQNAHEAAGDHSFATPAIIAARCGYAGILDYLANTHDVLSDDGAPATLKEWQSMLTTGEEKSRKPKLVPVFGGQPMPVTLKDLPRAFDDGQGTVRHWLKLRYQIESTPKTGKAGPGQIDVVERSRSKDGTSSNEGSRSDDDEADNSASCMRNRRGLSPLNVKTTDLRPVKMKSAPSQGNREDAQQAQKVQQLRQQQQQQPQPQHSQKHQSHRQQAQLPPPHLHHPPNQAPRVQKAPDGSGRTKKKGPQCNCVVS